MSESIPQLLTPEQARRGATALAGVRGAIGLGALLAPGVLLAPWVGPRTSSTRAGKLLGRSLGGRDLALAAGPLLAMRHDAPVRGWIEGGMLSDAADTVGMLLAWGHLPKRTRWLVLASTLGAVTAGFVISSSLGGDGGSAEPNEEPEQAEETADDQPRSADEVS